MTAAATPPTPHPTPVPKPEGGRNADSSAGQGRAPRLSGLVVAHNEEENLPDCLASLAFVDEIVVVLDKCTDGSKAIAERLAHRIVEGAWAIEGERRNLGIANCTGDWILELDADERATPELGAEIRRVIEHAPPGHFLVPVLNHIGGRYIRHGWAAYNGRSAHAGLFSKGAKSWGLERVHPSLALGPRQGRLTEGVIHYVDRNLSDMIDRLNRDTSKRAADLRDKRIDEGLFHNVRRIFSRSWKSYVSRKGYKEGKYGIMLALFSGLYPILSYLKATLEDE